jgi:hypothetical protein
MAMFHVGQKVVCVNGSAHANYSDIAAPVRGAVYTIREIVLSEAGNAHFLLVEIRNPARDGFLGQGLGYGRGEPRFHHNRFRPIVTRKTDISIFTEILRKHSSKQGADA